MGCKVNQTKKNYFIPFLLEFNPSAVFIFNLLYTQNTHKLDKIILYKIFR